MNSVLKYLLLTIVTCGLATGSLVATATDLYPRLGYGFLWAAVPLTALFMIAVVVNRRFAVPRLLLRDRYAGYALFTMLSSYTVICLALLFEHVARSAIGLPQRISDYTAPWALVDSVSNCVLFSILLLGLGAFQLYGEWRRQASVARDMTARLRRYMAQVRNRLDRPAILRRVDSIISALEYKDGSASEKILELSEWLRCQLYEMPLPPLGVADGREVPDYSRLSEFLVGKKMRKWRIVVFQSMLLLICAGSFSVAPDKPAFSMSLLAAALGLYGVLCLITYINTGWLYRRFLRHHDVRRYVGQVVMLIVVLAVPLVAIQLLTYNPVVYTTESPFLLSVLGAICSIITLALFVGGVTAMMLLKEWVSGHKRVIMLRAETARQEYAFLKKQINPHFLFNVLNNAGIVSEEDPEEALEMVVKLRRLIEYQFRETDSDTITLSDEVMFMDSYLSLEETRVDGLRSSVAMQEDVGCCEVPTLLFIPFVENAVKHGRMVNGVRSVEVSFSRRGDILLFECRNSFVCNPGVSSASRLSATAEKHFPGTSARVAQSALAGKGSGGIGLSNTLRRLELLYGDRYVYTRNLLADSYTVTLEIPL